MPDGTHWFPAVDVCKKLGYTTTRKAHREFLETVTGSHSLSVPAGRGWRRDLQIIDLQGLILLVNACTKPACAPFKQWVAQVIETVQREGFYALEEVEVQPVGSGAPVAYAMPDQVAEAIVRLEAHNLKLDEELAGVQRQSLALQREMLTAQTAMAEAMVRIADRFEGPALRPAVPSGGPATTASVLAGWRERLSVTEDVWTVAVVIAPVLVEKGELREPLKSIAERTGLTVRRVNECLRMLRRHACIRSRGGA
ncbi:Bro-N domain-containing protein [Streptomyces bauhiniae]|uniref:BRO-N domain-containing protein n=1 Tax=Streptomyces bauhiniae TaxID=2340725 RepID=UPI00382BAFEC